MGGDARVSRRVVLRVLGAGAISALVPLPLAVATASCDDDGSNQERTNGPFFSDEERRALAALSNAVLPPDASGEGASDLGAAPFIERLLTAFDVSPPALFADGPYSGRQPFADAAPRPENDFVRFRPLDRVTELAWRIKLYGSKAVPGGTLNEGLTPAVIGLRDLIRDNVRRAMSVASSPLETLDLAAIKDAFINLDPAFQEALVELVPQAAFGAPEYGGNPNLAGWRLIHFEGDTLPFGYSVFDPSTNGYRDRPDAPLTTANTAPDPAPLTPDIEELMAQIVSFTGGRKFP